MKQDIIDYIDNKDPSDLLYGYIYHPKEDGTIGMYVTTEFNNDKITEYFLHTAGFDSEMIDFLKNTTEEDRARLRKLVQLEHHRKQVKILEEEISK